MRAPGQATWHPGTLPGEGQREEEPMARSNRPRLSWDGAQKLVTLLLGTTELAVQLIDAISHIHG